MRKLERRRKLRTKGHFFTIFISNTNRFIFNPARFVFQSMIVPLLSLRIFQGMAAISLVVLLFALIKSHLLDGWLERQPTRIEIVLTPGPLRNALEARSNEVLELSKRRKLNRREIIDNIRASLASFPAISSARIQSSLSGLLTVSVQVHRVLFAMGDKEGNKIYFNPVLKVIGTSSSRSEIMGLDSPPFVLQADGVRLTQDKSGVQRVVRQSTGVTTQMNIPFYYRSANSVLAALKANPSNAEVSFVTEPLQTVSFSDEYGFSVCLATDNAEVKTKMPAKGCVKVIIGPAFEEQSFTKIIRNLAEIIKRETPESIDLRVTGRALLKPSDLAIRQGQNSE